MAKPQLVKTTKGDMRYSFGMLVAPETPDITTARWAFANYEAALAKGCDRSRPELFWFMVDVLWGPKSEAKKKFVRHPWAEWMTDKACEHSYLGVSGAGSSGKSDWGAVWALINWWCDPDRTKVLVTSTTMKDAQKRIWGSVRDYYYGAALKLPGKYVHSFGQIRTNVTASDDTASDKSGIELIPCSQSKEAQAIGRLIGMKSPRMIVIADELPELTPAILEACEVNLSSNPIFQLVALGNHGSWLDPFGQFVTPKAGINSVTVDDEEWETTRGWCIHLDGTKSPNFDHEKDVWPIYGRKQKREHDKIPSNSVGFWRFCRSFPPQDAEAGQIYSEIEIIANGCVSKPEWKGPVVRLAALDPSFTNGGDRCFGYQFLLGETTDGKMCLAPTIGKPFYADVTEKVPHNFQLARQFMDWCKQSSVLPENVGVDATGGGTPFADIVAQEWSPRINRIHFGGKASDMPSSLTEGKTGEDEYVNRVSELWYQGVQYIRSGQIKGLHRSCVVEMVARRYKHVKGQQVRIQVESKEEMKKRTKMSPDESDCFFIGLEIARIRHSFFPTAFGQALKDEIAKEEEDVKAGVNVLDDFECLADEGTERY